MTSNIYPALIISGGQTGVDRAALDAAAAEGIGIGGWCPEGRQAEDGLIPDFYPLRETTGSANAVRTAKNVCDSDATLVLHRGTRSPGTELTCLYARREKRPLLIMDIRVPGDIRAPGDERVARNTEVAVQWLCTERPRTLNVAGPRESEDPGIGIAARLWLSIVLRRLRNKQE